MTKEYSLSESSYGGQISLVFLEFPQNFMPCVFIRLIWETSGTIKIGALLKDVFGP